MKNMIRFLSIVWLLLSLGTAFAQDKPADIRLSPEEQLIFERSVKLNPAKIATLTLADPKMESAPLQVSPVVWKPVNTVSEEKTEVMPASKHVNSMDNEAPLNQPGALDSASQPAAANPQGKITNYREIKGVKAQPQAQSTGNQANYRNIKGSKSQPEGEKPKH